MVKILCIILMFSLAFAGCSANLKATYDIKDESIYIDNNVEYKNSKNDKIDILKFAEAMYSPNRLVQDQYDIKLAFGLDIFRKYEYKGDSVVYSVHQVEQGGLLYIFYITYKNDSKAYIENWFYSKKEISKKNFEKIGAGSSKREVLDIDPATQVYLNRYESDPKFKSNISLIESYHYLTDGCMRIYWEYKEDNLVVQNIEFFEDYNVRRYTSVKEYYNCKVLDKDTLWYDPKQA